MILRESIVRYFRKRIELLHEMRFESLLLGLMLLAICYRIALYYGLKSQDIPPLSFSPSISLRDFLSICKIDFPLALLTALVLLPVGILAQKYQKGTCAHLLEYGFVFVLTVLCAVYLVSVAGFGVGLTIGMLTSSATQLNLSEIGSFTPMYVWWFLIIANFLFLLARTIKVSAITWTLIVTIWVLACVPPSKPLQDQRSITPAILYLPGCYTLYHYWQFSMPRQKGVPVKVSSMHFKGKAFEDVTTASSSSPIIPLTQANYPRHIVFFIIESMRYDSSFDLLGGQGRVPMPFLKKLEEHSVVLEHHYSTSNNSFPSLFSIITGLYPSAENMDLILAKRTCIPTILSFLQDQNQRGRQAVWVTPGNDNFYFPTALIKHGGFELIGKDQIPTYGRKDVCAAARNEFSGFDFFKEKFVKQIPSDSPTVDVYETFVGHFYYNDYGVEFRVVQNPHRFYDRYLNNLYIADLLLKQVCDMIEADPSRRNNTILVVTGDHGESFGEKGFMGHGTNPYDNAVHVPCVIYAPNFLKPSRITIPTSHADLVPTLLDMVHQDYNPDLFQGDSLLRPLNRRYIFNAGYEGSIFAISKNLVKTIWFPAGKRLVYDLQADPTEQHPLNPDLYNEQFNTMFAFEQRQAKLLMDYQNDIIRHGLKTK